MPNDQIEMLWRCSISTCNRENRGRDMKCAGCGKPKTDDEEYYMPGDISHAAAITDASLLKKALAGPNWSCKFCESDQRRLDGACAQCGAKQEFSTKGVSMANDRPKVDTPPQPVTHSHHTEELQPDRNAYVEFFRRNGAAIGIIAGILAVITLVTLLLLPKKVDVRTSGFEWSRTVHVDRYQVNAHEGFSEDEPSDAFDVASQGQRYHHTDKVYDHDDTEHYTVSVACGETCREVPERCYTTPRNCTSNKNGFASCSGGDEVCTGGGQTCTTKYCDETRSRQVPVYRDVPRFATWYSWRVWEWTHNRDVAEAGNTEEVFWPSADKIALGKFVSGNEKERASYEEHYTVIFADKDGKTYGYGAKTYDEFMSYRLGAKHIIKVGPVTGIEVFE